MSLPDLRVLGPVTVVVAGQDVVVPAGRQQQVLAHLVVRRDEPVSTARLTEVLWGDAAPSDPANALQYVVARLRRLLEPDRVRGDDSVIRRVGDGYRLSIAASATDVGRLEDAVSRARAGDAARLAAAVEEWRGTPFVGLEDDLTLVTESRRLSQLHLEALELWADHALEAGEPGVVADRLAEVVGEDRAGLHEGLHRRLALAQYRRGRQVDALEILDRVADRLAEELGLDPSPALGVLRDGILRHDDSLTGPSARRGGGRRVPAPTDEFVGRRDELRQVAERLDTHRLVTLFGPAGAGKTRLAVEAARATDPDAVWVELQPVRSEGLVATTVAEAVGLHENVERDLAEVLAERLDATGALLVLDGVEHLVGEVAGLVAALLARAPALRVLATSRTRVDIRGEQVLDVRPLEPPRRGGPNAWTSPAVQLFVARAAALDPLLEVDAAVFDHVVEIVHAVDGLPLAIELAAGRTRVLGVEEVAARLRATLDVLAVGERDRPDRHRNLGAALDWSLDLLDPGDRTAMGRLAVFASFDLDAAEQVADVTSVDQLTRLADRSLLRPDPATGRFHVLAPLRTHLWQQLRPEIAEGVVGRFLAWVDELVTAAGRALSGPGQLAALDRLDHEYANVRLALEVATRPGARREHVELAQRLLGWLSWWWDWRGRFAEADLWSTRVAALIEEHADLVPTPRLASWAAFAAMELGEFERAADLVAPAVATAWVDGFNGMPGGVTVRSVIRRRRGDLEGAEADAREVLRAGVEASNPWTQGWAHAALAHTAAAAEDGAGAAAHAQRALALFEEAGDRRGVAWARTALADALRVEGDSAAAARSAKEAVNAAHGIGDVRSLAWALRLAAEATGNADDRIEGVVRQLRGLPVEADESPTVREGRRLAANWDLDELVAGV